MAECNSLHYYPRKSSHASHLTSFGEDLAEHCRCVRHDHPSGRSARRRTRTTRTRAKVSIMQDCRTFERMARGPRKAARQTHSARKHPRKGPAGHPQTSAPDASPCTGKARRPPCSRFSRASAGDAGRLPASMLPRPPASTIFWRAHAAPFSPRPARQGRPAPEQGLRKEAP